MNKLLVICGPTATGKTSLGIRLAKKFNGEIVSADSRQVYRGMDIGTGKDLPVNSKFHPSTRTKFGTGCPEPTFGLVYGQAPNSKHPEVEQSSLQGSPEPNSVLVHRQFQILNLKFQLGYYLIDGIRVWLYDMVNPDYQFSVADYVKCANVVIEDVWKRKKLPILVGGTGFYIKALIDGIETLGVPQDWKLREKLQNWTREELQEILERTCPERIRGMNESDRKNPRRLIRAIEVVLSNKKQGKKAQKLRKELLDHRKHREEDILMIGLTAPLKVVYQRIDKRVEERVGRGVEKEIRKLLGQGYSWEASALSETIGYKEWQPFFKGKATKKEVIQRWKFDEHGFARRQMTWFKKFLRQALHQTVTGQAQGKKRQVYWLDISKPNFDKKAELMIRCFYAKKD